MNQTHPFLEVPIEKKDDLMDKTRPKQKAQRHLHLIAKSTALFLFEIYVYQHILRVYFFLVPKKEAFLALK